jgi:serpin B
MVKNFILGTCVAALMLTACVMPAEPPALTPEQTAAPAQSSPTPQVTNTSTAPALTPTPPKGANVASESDETIRNELAAANMRFGIRLFNQIVEQDESKNVFISPTSVAIALAMTYNGASGETQQAMADTLGLSGMSLDDVNSAYAALRASLINADPKVQLSIANSLWLRQGVTLNDAFVQHNQLYYRAQVQELDFASPDAVNTINNWVSDNTNGKIPTIVDQIPSDMMLYLINAIYFKGDWTRQFDKAKTADQPFHLLDGSTKSVPLMTQSGTFTYFQNDSFQAVSLPYGDGRLNMLVFLPAADSSLQAFEQTLTETNWSAWVNQFHKAEGTLKLPRFSIDGELSLNMPLQALGMQTAFDPRTADFSAMGNGGTQFFISEVKHKTFLEVNEEGTEAAAATSIGMGATSIKPEGTKFSMIVDRPFFIAIRDSDTGTLLFMGAIVQP